MDHDLGPFEPPKEYAFEPELQGKPVRPIPPELKQGWHGLSQYSTIRGLAIAGFCCVASAELPLLHTLSFYILPLAYLNWIGVALLAGAALAYANAWRERGPYLWVKNGTPFIARVREIVVQPSMYVNGQPTNWCFHAQIEWRSAANESLQAWVQSFAVNEPSGFTTSFCVGDYVTALSMPDDKQGTIVQLYGFLGLKPGLGVVSREARAVKTTRQIVAILAAVFGGLAVLFYGIKYMPIDFPVDPFLAGLAAVPVLAAWPGYGIAKRIHDRRLAALRERNEAAVARGEAILNDPNTYHQSGKALYFGSLMVAFLGLIGVMLAAVTLNAKLDFAKRTYRPVRIDNMIQTTWNGVIREYKIEFHLLDERFQATGSKHSLMSTPTHMETFKSRAAVATIGQGFFGLPWVESIDPFPVTPEADPSPQAGRGAASR